MALIVLGIDPSLTSTGYSYADKTGIISSNKKGVERLNHFALQLEELIAEIGKPLIVVIEGYSFASRASQAHSAGELGGVLRLTMFRLGVPFIEVPPTCRAKFATGRGNASKNEVISSISARTGIVWLGKGADDLADAWILEEMGRCIAGNNRFSWPKPNMDALNNLDWSPLEALKATLND